MSALCGGLTASIKHLVVGINQAGELASSCPDLIIDSKVSVN